MRQEDAHHARSGSIHDHHCACSNVWERDMGAEKAEEDSPEITGMRKDMQRGRKM